MVWHMLLEKKNHAPLPPLSRIFFFCAPFENKQNALSDYVIKFLFWYHLKSGSALPSIWRWYKSFAKRRQSLPIHTEGLMQTTFIIRSGCSCGVLNKAVYKKLCELSNHYTMVGFPFLSSVCLHQEWGTFYLSRGIWIFITSFKDHKRIIYFQN